MRGSSFTILLIPFPHIPSSHLFSEINVMSLTVNIKTPCWFALLGVAIASKYKRFNTIINDIGFKMIRKDDNCWIKAVPITQLSTPSSLHIILNGEEHHWDVYDESGRDIHKVYFEGYQSTPSFYLKSGEHPFRIDCDVDDIKVLPITETHKIDTYLRDNCACISPQASCWAKAIYSTSRPDKPPFDEM